MAQLEFIDKFVCLQFKNGKKLCGECFTIDPVTNSVVLITKKISNLMVEVVLSHDLIDIQVMDIEHINRAEYLQFKEVFLRKLFPEQHLFTSEDLLKRRDKLYQLLELNRLPVTVQDNGILSVVNGIALIEPPYTVDTCRSANTIVLDRVMRIVETCQKSYDE
ncbi:uncharacterized protein LOC105847063 [Hydra vulgaris]|uniref:uncharacterized protein LOC105847063 n=1 Tax=Hydra vulgaris TaxID=6087 RepID=UPI001F5E6533|nr:uncharacterized protein LOC105847063 [Hydra vulgaris]